VQRFLCRDCRDAVPGGIAAVATWRKKKNEGKNGGNKKQWAYASRLAAIRRRLGAVHLNAYTCSLRPHALVP
jgi:hypothetical protein